MSLICRSNWTTNYKPARPERPAFAQSEKSYILNALVSIMIPCIWLVGADNSSLTCSADELIRQITINCAERGLLLLRVRDEARMTITAYETLYESSIAYGVRKALVAEQKRIDLEAKLRELAAAKRELQQQVESLKHTIESTQARSIQKREAEEKAHADEVRSLPLFC